MTGRRPPLRGALGDYLSLRRALGFQLASAGRLLEQFVGYLEAHSMDTVTTEHALAWAGQPAAASVHWRAIRLSVVRGFAAYLHSLDPSAEVIPAGLFRPGVCRATPYLYSQAEIGLLIDSPEIARQALARFDAIAQPANSYILMLTAQNTLGRPKLVWRTEQDGKVVDVSIEPMGDLLRGVRTELLALLPIDDLL